MKIEQTYEPLYDVPKNKNYRKDFKPMSIHRKVKLMFWGFVIGGGLLIAAPFIAAAFGS